MSNITLFRAEEEFVDEFDSWEEFKLDKTFRCDVCGTWFVREGVFMHVVKKHIKNGKCECRKSKNSKSEEVTGVKERCTDEHEHSSNNAHELSAGDAAEHPFNRSEGSVSFLNVETIKNANINDSIKQHVKGHITYIFKGRSVYDKIGHFIKVYLTKERLKKINTIVTDEGTISKMKEHFNNFTYVDIGKASAWRGAKDLMRIDVAKELWMTDKEWNATRLRVLKEKLLFYL
ncbi:Actin-related protein [Trachipleistophora hominis]|uniref:Actin-related protein n=1 Tax=Trachipleistophora hominis TaxID=72359 RepID=L7JVQ1_TRAHO|nr:Actin-related protein [Trachipleistophora hominis]